MGGNGGTGNAAGNVDVESVGNITTGVAGGSFATPKANSSGIVAQSIGGGGGNGGFSLLVSGSYNSVVSPITPKTVGGNGGSGGVAGDVSVSSTGTVLTNGALSYGILAQSVGGGGGNGGFSVGAALSYKGGADINSVGGSGGAGNNAGTVTVNASSSTDSSLSGYSIYTLGAGSDGILAQSIGGGGGNGGFSVAGSLEHQR